jgi:iron(III) transport system substrate-binding protein
MKLVRFRAPLTMLALAVALLVTAACSPVAAPADDSAAASDTEAVVAPVVVYSGRNENLVGPLLQSYGESSGAGIEVRYGGTSEMAATILEEGDNSPADVFFGQDAGALGALARAGRCIELPEAVTEQVNARFVSPDNRWVGLSGRARVLVYNTDTLTEADLPSGVFELTGEEWAGKVGWAPTNGSFQAFVTAMRVNAGEDVARQWLEDMLANDVQSYANNTAIVEAVGKGEVEVGLVNHYYLFRFLAEDPEFPAANYYFPNGDLGAMINAAGVCVVNTSDNQEAALAMVNFLLSDEAQQYFADETDEYPLVNHDIAINPAIRPLAEIDSPEFDLGDTEDLQGTLELLQEVGALDQ